MTDNQKPLVSVIVPCYNHGKYVGDTINSILNQTYVNIELIVIDDGSQDNSVSVIKYLADKYNFTFIQRSNKGLCATLNEGISIAKGKYFCACASDDIYIKDKIFKQVDLMENNPEFGMCYGRIIQFDGSGNEEKREIKRAKSGWIFKDLILVNFSILAVATMIKKDVFDTVGLYDESLYVEDYDMWLRIANKYQVGYLNDYLAYYRKHETNISNQTFKMYTEEKKIFDKWKEHKLYSKAIRKRSLVWFRRLAISHKVEARKYFGIAISNSYKFKVLKTIIKFLFSSKEKQK